MAAALAPLVARPFTAVVTAAEPGEGAGGALGTVAGLFTWHWCRAAAQVPDPDGDGWIEAREIFARACAAVQQDAFLDHRAQSPDWRASEGTDTFLVPRRAAGG